MNTNIKVSRVPKGLVRKALTEINKRNKVDSISTSDFKKLFNKVATNNGLKKIQGGWFIESKECIVTLNLQKSNYSNLYYLNIKTYIQGLSGENYKISKYLVVNDIGDIFIRAPLKYNKLFDLENNLSLEQREEKLNDLFNDFLNHYISMSLSKLKLLELADTLDIYILPEVKKKLLELT